MEPQGLLLPCSSCGILLTHTSSTFHPKRPLEDSYNESFNGLLMNELLNGEIFHTLKEAKILIEQWRIHYNTVRPHSALNWKPPAPESLFQLDQGIMIN